MAEFKKGDKVRLIDSPSTRRDHKNHPDYYPEPGTVGTVYDDSDIDGTTLVEWPKVSIHGARCDWWAHTTDLALVENAAPDYYIRVTATSEHGAQVEVNGPADWVHEALAQAIMKLNTEDPLGVLAAVMARALDAEEGDDGTE